MVVLLFSVGIGASAEPESAHKTVEKATSELVERLKEIRPLYEEDKDKFFQEVENAVSPLIDFEGFARGVMAKYYRRATDAQKEKFVETFKESLVETYGGTLAGFQGNKVEVEKPAHEDADSDRASVKLKIHGADGDVYSVAYTMIRQDGRWKLRNITVEGINIGLQFRSQFASYMREHGNDIDKVIENWDVDEDELADE
ncbi:MAG: ABC transporter substrate-binding protein [Pseudomonadales bacterium]